MWPLQSTYQSPTDFPENGHQAALAREQKTKGWTSAPFKKTESANDQALDRNPMWLPAIAVFGDCALEKEARTRFISNLPSSIEPHQHAANAATRALFSFESNSAAPIQGLCLMDAGPLASCQLTGLTAAPSRVAQLINK